MRRVTVSSYRGKKMIAIREVRVTRESCDERSDGRREVVCLVLRCLLPNSSPLLTFLRLLQYYEKDGEEKPGKKGESEEE